MPAIPQLPGSQAHNSFASNLSSMFASRPFLTIIIAFLSISILSFIVWGSLNTFTTIQGSGSGSTSHAGKGFAPAEISKLQAIVTQLQQQVEQLTAQNKNIRTTISGNTTTVAISPSTSDASAWSPLRYNSVTPPTAREAFLQSGYTRNAIATLISIDAGYCHAVWVWYKSIRKHDPNARNDILIMFTKDQRNDILDRNPFCAELKKYTAPPDWNEETQKLIPVDERKGYVWFTEIDEIPLASWHTIGSSAWRYSLNRLEIFKFEQYERILYLDADLIAHRNFDELFAFTNDLTAVADQWDGCNVRRTMNGGVLSFRPSYYLYRAAIDIFNKYPSCLSKGFVWSDQEVINCMCGFGGATVAERRDLQCGLIPPYVSICPRDFQCSYFRDDDSILIHFATYPKPWTWTEGNCVPDAHQGLRNQSLEWFQARPKCYSEVESFFSLWHCYDNRGSLALEVPDCLLIHINNINGRQPIDVHNNKNNKNINNRLGNS